MKLFQRPPMNHTPHILASVFLCGLWLPVWALISATYNPPWRCSFCGYSDATEYLANPRLKQIRISEAQQRAQIAEQVRVDRAGSTLQERSAYFISDYQRELIAAGVLTGLIGLGGIIAIFVNKQKQPQIQAPTPAISTIDAERDAIRMREAFATGRQQRYEPQYPGIKISAVGTKNQTLLIRSPNIGKTFVESFGQPENRSSFKKNGFTDARIEGSKKQEWRVSF